MDKTVSITLQFRDLATAGMQSAVAKIGSSLEGLAAAGTKATTTMIGGFNTMATKVGGAISNFMQKATLASLFIGGTFVASMGAAVNMAADFERFGKAAEFMTGSADAANKFAKAVREVSLATMFNVDEIAQMESRLVGNTRDVDLSTTALKALTEAVAATGGAFPELEGATRAWIQVNSKAKLSSEELNRQFANANIPVVRLLAESIVKDLNHPLRKYIETAGDATGASKTLTTAYKKGQEVLEDNTWKTDKLTAAVSKAKDKFGESSYQYKQATEGLGDWNQKVIQANSTIGKYTEAQKSAGKATHGSTLTVKEAMAALQEVGDLNIPGTIGAESITRALNEAYGGANLELIKTFSGRLSMLKDALKLTVLSFIGLDENFRVVEGGILDLLTKGLKPLVDWLQKNQEAMTKFGREIGGSLPFLTSLAGILMGAVAPALLFLFGKVIIMAGAFGGLGLAIGLLINWMKDGSTAAYMFAGAFGALITVITISNLVTKFNDIRLAALAFFNTIKLGMVGMVGILAIGAMIGYIISQWSKLDESTKVLAITIGTLTSVIGSLAFAWMGLTAAMALNPIGAIAIAVSALLTGFALLVTQTDVLKTSTQLLADAHNRVYDAQKKQVDLIQSLYDAQLREEGASIAARDAAEAHAKATDAVNTAVRIYGENSPQAVEARKNEEKASLADKVAANEHAKSIDAVNTAGDEYVKQQPEIEAAAQKEKDITEKVAGGWKSVGDAIWGAIHAAEEWIKKKFGEIKGGGGGGGAGGAGQHGMIVPGAIGSPVPIMAHGGERIIPRGSNVNPPYANQGGGGTTINFYGDLTVDSEDRVRQLADQIIGILGRQNELARYGF